MTTEQEHSLPPIRKTVILRASAETVWKAIASAEGIAAWWMPNTFEPVVGHTFTVHSGHFGDSPCKVTEIIPLERVSFSWGADWQLTFELKVLAPLETEFTLIHSGWDNAKLTEFGQPHSVIREVMNGGWESIVHERLAQAIAVED